MNGKEFDDKCMRFGRILNDEMVYTWRWVGFHYGIDLLVTFMNRSFTIKRNTTNIYSPYKGLLSNKQKQRIYLMIRVANLDKYGNCKWFKQSDFAYLDLSRNEEKFVLNLDMNVQMPLIMNLHVTSHPNNLTRELFQNSN
jgi:BTB/POZ domain-containing protein 13